MLLMKAMCNGTIRDTGKSGFNDNFLEKRVGNQFLKPLFGVLVFPQCCLIRNSRILTLDQEMDVSISPVRLLCGLGVTYAVGSAMLALLIII